MRNDDANHERGKDMRPLINILTPVFNEAQGLDDYVVEVEKTLFADTRFDWEVILVDDGSRDESWEKIQALCRRDARFVGVRLSRNFGSHTALSAAFSRARGDAAVTLAADLQDPPETVLAFLAQWKNGAKIVWGERRRREDRLWRAWTSRVFFKLIRRYAMPAGSRFRTGSFLLADRQVVECYNQFHEANRITFALIAWTGFPQAVVPYDRRARQAGQSGWSFGKMLRAMYDTFVGYSLMPARVITVLGAIFFVVAAGVALHVLVNWWAGDPVPGWSGIMFAMTSFFAIEFVVLGLIGEYLSRIYAEVVRRPLYFVQEEVRFSARRGDDG